MMSMYQALGKVCSGLGLTMLLASFVLFPQHRLVGETITDEKVITCPGHVCTVGCEEFPSCFTKYSCTGPDCKCDAATFKNCAVCNCILTSNKCVCQ